MNDFHENYMGLMAEIMDRGEEVEVGEWQSQDVRDKPEMISREMRHRTFSMAIPRTIGTLQEIVVPNLPWAEDHFLERVSGEPLNPPPSEAWWPFRVKNNEAHKQDEKFSHTYPERIWPKYGGDLLLSTPNAGLRYYLGDLNDLVSLLAKNPLTRQAYLPIWFPEDTGAVEGQRVPCTIGYHFLVRNNLLDIVYYIRSCDLLRHFRDDVYMAARLAQWVCDELQSSGLAIRTGQLVMYISSLHYFRGDYPMVNRLLGEWEENKYGAPV